MSVRNEGKEGKATKRREKDHRRGLRQKGRVRRRKNCKSAVEGNRLRGLLVVGRRTLQIPVNRIQLRCYREYRWRLFPSVHPIHNARPYDVGSRARTKGRGGSVYVYGPLSYVLTTKPCDCFRMFQNMAPETRFSLMVLSDSLTPCLNSLLNIRLE